MKKLLLIVLALLCGVLAASCASDTKNNAPVAPAEKKASAAGSGLEALKNKKVLVAYFSASGNTKQMAESIAKKTGGDLFRIERATPYAEAYNALTEEAKDEKNRKVHPPLKEKGDITQYDVIFVGFPAWWYTLPMPVFTYLESHNFTGKIVVPFMTHGGGGEYNCFREVAETSKAKTTLKGLALPGGSVGSSEGQIESWLNGLSF